MDNIKREIEKMKEEGHEFNLPWLQLGIKQEGGGVKPTGKHIVKIVEEPERTKDNDPMTGKEREIFLFTLEENGQQKKWSVPLFTKEGEPHYLLTRLEDIPVGEMMSLEMKKAGMKSYIEVGYPVEGDGIPVVDEDGNY